LQQTFSDVVHDLYTYVDTSSARKSKLIADDVYEIIMAHKVSLEFHCVMNNL
jgi:ribonucleoside-diphosphate reductase alpha chain